MRRLCKSGKISEIIQTMKDTNEIEKVNQCENLLNCRMTAPLMFMGALLHLLFGAVIWKENVTNLLANAAIFFCLFLLFVIAGQLYMLKKWQTYLIAFLHCLLILFLVVRIYEYAGPAIWIVVCIQIVFAMTRIQMSMAYIISVFAVLMSTYMIFRMPGRDIVFGYTYYIPNTLMLIALVFVLSLVYRTNTGRFQRLQEQYRMEVKQKTEIETLYKKLEKEENDIRIKNEELLEYTSELKKRDERLYDLAYFDILTGLPNRKMMMEHLEALVERRREDKRRFFLIFIDVDSFKNINDTIGHHYGDQFISYTAERFRQSIIESDVLGRIGGDEFALVIERNLSVGEVQKYIEAIRKKFTQPVKIENTELRLTASFGIATFPNDGDTAIKILKSADLAMYKAKAAGKNTIRIFEKYMQLEIEHKEMLESKLVTALEKNEMFLVYQPQYDINGSAIRGVEVFLRWNLDGAGIKHADEFVPIAEGTGLIISIGVWAIEKACIVIKSLNEKYGSELSLSMNVSPVQLKDDRFYDFITGILERTGFNPRLLELEIKETIFVDALQQANILVLRLKALGIKIALDDFGVGYSSMNHLKQIPIDTLKLDYTIVNGLSRNDGKADIVGDMISFAHNFDIDIIAEGVENLVQLQHLDSYGCDYIQGYLFSRELEQRELEDLLRQIVISEM